MRHELWEDQRVRYFLTTRRVKVSDCRSCSCLSVCLTNNEQFLEGSRLVNRHLNQEFHCESWILKRLCRIAGAGFQRKKRQREAGLVRLKFCAIFYIRYGLSPLLQKPRHKTIAVLENNLWLAILQMILDAKYRTYTVTSWVEFLGECGYY